MSKARVILISGKQGSGKTTTSNALIKALGESGLTPINLKFADVLYKMHDAALAVAAEYGIPVLKKEGAMLQWLGTEWGRNTKGENVWVNAVRHKVTSIIASSVKPSSLVFIIDDCRFVNEFKGFDDLEENGLVDVIRVRLEASEEERKTRADSWRTATDHPSETGLDGYADSGLFDMYFETGKDGLSTGYIIEEILNTLEFSLFDLSVHV
jgi:hypothetical protein